MLEPEVPFEIHRDRLRTKSKRTVAEVMKQRRILTSQQIYERIRTTLLN